MSWLIAGTVPDDDFGLVRGTFQLRGTHLELSGRTVSVARGTPALMAAAAAAATVLGLAPLECLLAGDTGHGAGSRALYARFCADVPHCRGLTFHYLLPDIRYHNDVLWALEELNPRPLLAADAGFMYAAKMSGFADHYDLFTPDAGEMAFLADERAPHPFYTRGFLLQEEERIPELIQAAYAEKNAARHLLVKGKTDYVVAEGRILHKISEPLTAAMEAIGGTGDTLTGMVTALMASGMDIPQACHAAAKANRLLGRLAQPSPATTVAELLPFLPQALEQALQQI
jgi:hypothetical protein